MISSFILLCNTHILTCLIFLPIKIGLTATTVVSKTLPHLNGVLIFVRSIGFEQVFYYESAAHVDLYSIMRILRSCDCFYSSSFWQQ